MELRAAFAFLLALFLAMALVPAVVPIARPLGLIDSGGGRKIHDGVIPRTGGIAIFLGCLVPLLLWLPPRADLSAFLVAAAILFVFGVLDDRYNLDYRLKLLGQATAALIVTLYGAVVVSNLPLVYDGTLPQWIAVPFTAFALVGITNAINLSDGMDGLAGGISLLSIGCLALLAYQGGDGPVVIVALALMGAIFGFLRYNTFPARLFMGDAGSQFLGFSAGVLAVIVTQSSDPALSPTLPLLILGLPILDTLKVMFGRIARGDSPFQADRTHLHHRLLARGLSQEETVSLIYGTQFLLVVLAYLLRYSSDLVILATYALFSATVVVGMKVLERHRQRLRAREPHQTAFFRLIAAARRTRVLTKGPLWVLTAAVPIGLVAGALMVPSVTTDVGLLALVLMAGLITALRIRPLPFFMLERLSGYLAAASVVYLVGHSEEISAAAATAFHAYIGVVAVATAVWVRFSSARFKPSTLDLLILLAALTAPTLQGLGLRELGVIALEGLVLFYAIEVLMQERERHWDSLRVGVVSTLAVLAVKGLLFSA